MFVRFKVLEIKVSSNEYRETMRIEPLDPLIFQIELNEGMGMEDEKGLIVNAEELRWITGRAEVGISLIREEF